LAKLGTFNSRRNRKRFVEAIYLGLLRRTPSPKELAYWVSIYDHELPAEEMVCRIQRSKEFIDLTTERLFVPPGHFYSPIVKREIGERQIKLTAELERQDSLPGIAISRDEMVRVWRSLLPFLNSHPFAEMPGNGLRFGFENAAFSWADGLILHAILRLLKPARMIEIGSGWSSACALDTIERFLGNKTVATFIEPFPALPRTLIREGGIGCKFLEMQVQNVDLSIFDELQGGDILFIDSTHVLSTGSDVHFELFEVLQSVRSGVYVHIHDIFWPFEYPEQWVVEENRSWNEVYALRAFLTHNDFWEIVCFNDYFAKFEEAIIQATCPSFLRRGGGSLWLRRR
jgi:hypothetical protein